MRSTRMHGRVRRSRAVRLAVAVATALALGVVAAGCGSDDGGDSGGGASTSAGGSSRASGSIAFWFLSDPAYDQRWWDRMVADFRAEQPDVDVKVTKLETVPLAQKTIASYASGSEPDIYFNNGGEALFNLVRKGLVEPLDELIELGPFNAELVDAFRSDDGKAYGVPVGFGTPFAVWYDKRLFDRYGVEPPADWDGLMAMCRQLRGDGVAPIALGNSELWPAAIWFDTFVYQYGGTDILREATFGTNDRSWSDPAIVQAAERVKEMVDTGCFPDHFNGLTYSQQTDLWMRGGAGMTLLGEWAITTVRQGAPDGFELDYFLVPDAPGAAHSTAEAEGMEAVPSGLSVSARSENKPAVAAFLDFYGRYLEQNAQTSGRLSVAADPAPPTDPLERRMLRDAQSAGEFFIPTDTLVPAALVDDYYQALQQLTLGQITPEQFGEQMTQATEAKRAEFDAELRK
jgi:ABC-type glycerol-3-phosphate transport system substrate-binding protein